MVRRCSANYGALFDDDAAIALAFGDETNTSETFKTDVEESVDDRRDEQLPPLVRLVKLGHRHIGLARLKLDRAPECLATNL